MLLTKKKSFCIEEAIIKRDVTDENQETLVKINLRYPKIECGKKDPLNIFAKDFYKSFAESFAKYAETELIKRAKTAKSETEKAFVPFSAVMKYEVTQNDKDFLSLWFDVSICDGINLPSVERKTQVWEREFGTKCKSSYFIPKKEISEFLSESLTKEELKRFDNELFVLREDGLDFFLRENVGYRAVHVRFLQKNKEKTKE